MVVSPILLQKFMWFHLVKEKITASTSDTSVIGPQQSYLKIKQNRISYQPHEIIFNFKAKLGRLLQPVSQQITELSIVAILILL